SSLTCGAPLPVSSWFLDGLDRTTAAVEGGLPEYCLGEIYEPDDPVALVGYYPVLLATKLPIPLLILLALAVLGRFGKGPAAKTLPPSKPEAIVLVVVIVELLGYFMSPLGRVRIGIRHLLPALALCLIPAGRALAALF